ncbi:PfkB family carbohydrate kinase [Alsobacter sp. SYSU BS001988]
MRRVFVLGNATLDCVQTVARLPQPGETLLCDSLQRCAGGKGLNQAIASARTGAPTILAAPIGADPDAALLRSTVGAEAGLEARWIGSAQPTDYSAIWVSADAENVIVSSAAAAHGLTQDEALAALEDFGPGDLLVMQGNLSEALTAAAARRAGERGGFAILNTAPIAWDMGPVLGLFDCVIANAGETRALARRTGPEGAADLARRARGMAVVTLGAQGAILARDGETLAVEAPKVAAVDSAGAGDALVGAWAGGVACGLSVEAALRVAVAAASLAVTRRGTAPSFPSRDEMAGLLQALG